MHLAHACCFLVVGRGRAPPVVVASVMVALAGCCTCSAARRGAVKVVVAATTFRLRFVARVLRGEDSLQTRDT